MITREEMDSSSTTVLFNKYFFSSDNISLVQLAGLQYSNYGVYQSDDKKYNEAIEQLKKAYFMYPSERHKFLLKQLLVHQLSNMNYNTVEEVGYLAALCRFNNLNDEDISDKNIQAEFSRVVQTQLINNSDYAKLDSSYLLVTSALEKQNVKNDIAFNYHYELARIGFVTAKDSAYELKHLKAAYQLNPRNADLHTIILAYIGHLLEGKDNPEEVMKLMDQYSQTYTFLDTNTHYSSIRGKCFLELSYRGYSLQNMVSGDRFLKEFEVLADKQKDIKVEPVRVEKTYATAAGAYFKKGNYTKAKQVLKSGLTYAPGSFTLKQMLREF
jgi:tetratricopeptide (TPR) repeat protein